MKEIVCIGDSITQYGFEGDLHGWVGELSRQYVRKADVVNRGLAGYNTKWTLDFLRDKTQREKVIPRRFRMRGAENSSDNEGCMLYIVFFGANDSAKSHQFVSLEDFEANLMALVSLLREEYHAKNVILVTPPPFDGEAWLKDRRAVYGEDNVKEVTREMSRTAQYAQVVRGVAATCDTNPGASGSTGEEGSSSPCKVKCCDIFNIATSEGQEHEEWKRLLRDGLHFSKAGNELLARELMALIQAEMGEIHPDALEPELPLSSAFVDQEKK